MSSGHNLRLQKLHCSQIETNIQTTLIYLNWARGISTLQHISGRLSWNLHICMYPSTKSIFPVPNLLLHLISLISQGAFPQVWQNPHLPSSQKLCQISKYKCPVPEMLNFPTNLWTPLPFCQLWTTELMSPKSFIALQRGDGFKIAEIPNHPKNCNTHKIPIPDRFPHTLMPMLLQSHMLLRTFIIFLLLLTNYVYLTDLIPLFHQCSGSDSRWNQEFRQAGAVNTDFVSTVILHTTPHCFYSNFTQISHT